MTEARVKRPRSWKTHLLRTPRRVIKPILANAMVALREAPVWFGVLAFNEFSGQTTLMAAPPWETNPAQWDPRPVTPHDDLLITEWLQREGVTVDVGVAALAAEAVAKDRPFHPVREYLGHLKWDGIPRIGTWLHDYFGTEDNKYSEVIGRCMLVAAVARIYNPGCKVDNVPIIEGGQGLGKSSALRILFDPWFTDEIADLGSKDAAMQASGVWGIEMAELEAMSGQEAARAKAFISRTTDRFRPPYGRRLVETPRSSVIWGTTNSDTYLKDETGGRRFWPIRASKINLDALRRNRDQLWAEALEYHEAGIPWWIDDRDVRDAAAQEQAGRYVGDPWDNTIQRLAEENDELSIGQVLLAVGVEISRRTQREMNRVARCLKARGWHRVQAGSGSDRRWIYRKGRSEG